MSLSFPDLRIGEPQCHEGVSVFPVFSMASSVVEYIFSDDALGSGAVSVKEISDGGSVPELVVENLSDSLVLFIEGQELIGAKQNRILNSSVLVAPQSNTRIPVSCVERGRWRYRTRKFGSDGTHSPAKLRHLLKASVNRSIQEKRGHHSDQMAVWKEIGRKSAALGVASDTEALHDSYSKYADRVAEFGRLLPWPEGATGIAVAVDDKIVSVDLFDKPATCRRLWDRIVSGVVLDALEPREVAEPVPSPDVSQFLDLVRHTSWQPTPAVGEGQEFRLGTDSLQASALCFQDVLVHGSLVAAGG